MADAIALPTALPSAPPTTPAATAPTGTATTAPGPNSKPPPPPKANTRQVAFSTCVRECLSEYFALKDELSGCGSLNGKSGPMVQILFGKLEERIAKSLDLQVLEILAAKDLLKGIQAMIEKFVMLYLLHTPEVPASGQDAAFSSGLRRLEKWKEAWREQEKDNHRGTENTEV